MSEPLALVARIFAMLSLSAVGGANAALPELRRQVVVARGLMDDATFSSLVALAQAAPGPNVMTSSVVGWRLAGWPGFLVATLAMIGPSSILAFAAGRLLRRHGAHPVASALRRSLAPIAVGLMAASGLVLARAADTGALTMALTFVMSVLCATTRVNPLIGLGAAAALGCAVSLFGVPV